jgi:PAS domain S-box-containing protein
MLGTLCAIDTKPKAFTEHQRSLHAKLARQVVDQLELRKRALDLNHEKRHLELFRRFFDANADMLCTADSQGYFLEINQAWTRHLGWTLDELRSKRFLDWVHPEDREKTIAEATLLASQDLLRVSFENRYLHRDGSWVHLSWAATSQSGTVFAVARNVTLERQREEALRIQEAHLRALFDSLVAGVVVQNKQGKITRCNPSAERILGLTWDQLQGRTSIDPRWRTVRQDGEPFPGDEHPAMISLRTGKPVRDMVMGIYQPSGEFRWILINAQPFQAGDGPDADAVVTTFHDITDRISQESSRRAELLDTILNNLPASTLAIFDRDLTLKECFGRPILSGPSTPPSLLDWAPPEQRENLARIALQSIQGAPRRLDWSHGKTHLDVRLAPLPEGGRTGSQGLALAYDITERDEIHARAAHQDRLATTGILAAGVGHELNNPLTFVVSNLEFSMEELRSLPGAPAHQVTALRESLGEALEGAERIRKIVRGLRSFAREESAPTLTNLHAVVDISISMTRHELRHCASVVLKLDPVPPVMTDEARLAQVVVNLLINAAQAFKANDPGRNTITLRTQLTADARVALLISDNGPGIPPEVLPRIFDPFFTTKPVGRGTGLGLSISNSIVRSLGGELSCETEPGVGTTFRIVLPRRTTSRPPPHAPTPRRKRLLLVDDEENMLRVMVRMLQSEFEVIALADPVDALRRFEAGERFDAVCCDLVMPKLSGLELLRRVQELDPAQAARFAFLSGGIQDEPTNTFLENVSNAFLEKPFHFEDLKLLLRRLVGASIPPAAELSSPGSGKPSI